MAMRTDDTRGRLLKVALISRLFVLLISAGASNYAEPYDCSSTIASTASVDGGIVQRDGFFDGAVRTIFGGFARWDAVYFLRLAQVNVYEFEQFHAFFPFLPSCIRLSASFLRTVLGETAFGEEALLLLAGTIVTHLSFIAAALMLYELSLKVFEKEHFAANSSILFCFSPASIFFSAIYTESLFAFASFACMYCFVSSDKSLQFSAFSAAAWFAAGIASATVATAIRSNGIVLAAFGLHIIARRLWMSCKRLSFRRFYLCSTLKTWLELIAVAGLATVACTFVSFPYIRFQNYGHQLYCHHKNLDNTSAQNIRPWCEQEGISNLYAFVQKEYWNQGPFRYWTMKQIPNFLLATPVLLLCVGMSYTYKSARMQNNGQVSTLRNLENLFGFDDDIKLACERVRGMGEARVTSMKSENDISSHTVFAGRRTAAFVWHCSALALLMLICFHVQVATRFLFAASPALYWYVSDLVELRGEMSLRVNFVLAYFCIYFILGAALFSTFYPWT